MINSIRGVAALNVVMEPELKPIYEPRLAKVKEVLRDGGVKSAWEEGARWTLDEAVKKVLGESDN